VTINEEVQEMCKGYNVGDSLAFTATLNAIYDPEKAAAAPSGASEDASEEEEAVASSE